MIINNLKFVVVFISISLLTSCSYNDLTDLWPSGNEADMAKLEAGVAVSRSSNSVPTGSNRPDNAFRRTAVFPTAMV